MSTDCLDIDIGNSRTKWRRGDERGWLHSPDLPAIEGAVARVRIACVAGDQAALAREVDERFGVAAEFARTEPYLAGVSCGYRDPDRMGVDRWLGVVAAWNEARGACVVVGAGTALTLDFVTADGIHEGGYIVPGLTTMRESLRAGTANVAVDWSAPEVLAPAVTTADAVNRGLTLMMCDFVERSVARFRQRCENDPTTFVTGGDAEVFVSADLALPVRIEPDLVLDGLDLSLP